MTLAVFFGLTWRRSRLVKKQRQAESFASLSWVPGGEAAFAQDQSSWSSDSSTNAASGRREAGKRARLNSIALQRLTGDVQAFAQSCAPSEELVRKRETFVWELRTRLEDELPACRVVPFGSAVTGLWSKESDLDLSIEVNSFYDREASIHLLKRIARIIRRFSGDRPQTRFRASMPILRWAPTCPASVACDISVNNSLAIVNSRLVAQYITIDTRIWELAMVLKAWARGRNINDRSMGTLSSFALTLMLIHYLQKKGLLPCLQSLARATQEPSLDVAGIDCRYCTDPAAIAQEIARLRDSGIGCMEHGRHNTSSNDVGALLLGFFRHFGFDYGGGTISVNKLSADTTSCELRGRLACAKVPFFFVENPFEPGRDVATLEQSQIPRILTEIRRAHRLLSQGQILKHVFEPTVQADRVENSAWADSHIFVH